MRSLAENQDVAGFSKSTSGTNLQTSKQPGIPTSARPLRSIDGLSAGGRWRIKKSSLDRDILRLDKQGQPTVLVVDDDPSLRDLFRTFLKQIGFRRVVVCTAKEAINSLRKQKFDIMFLDLQLSDAPGNQVYKTAKQIDPDLNVS